MTDDHRIDAGDGKPPEQATVTRAGLLRGPDGKFLRGTRGGPGCPIARSAVNVKQTWVNTISQSFTPAVAQKLFDELVKIATKAKRPRDRVSAVSVLLDKLGISKDRLDELLRGQDKPQYCIQISYRDDFSPVHDLLPAPPTDSEAD